MAILTRPEMEQVIANGGSVLHSGRLLTRVEHLPTAADLAKGDPAAETVAANALKPQIADLQAQLNKLAAPAQPAASGGTASMPDAPGLVETFGQQIADRLGAAGFDTPEKLAAASDADLLAIEGIGDGTLKKIRATYPG
jgi:predicted flap endonuclease-1-like 5' DNA nuclease